MHDRQMGLVAIGKQSIQWNLWKNRGKVSWPRIEDNGRESNYLTRNILSIID